MTLRFDEPVEVAFGAVRVYDAAGERVDRGPARAPGRPRRRRWPCACAPALPDGVYTATYRVVSADSHPVTGGFVFSVGAGGAAPRLGVDELIDRRLGRAGDRGRVRRRARALSYLAIALGAGGLVFASRSGGPALRAARGRAGRGARPARLRAGARERWCSARARRGRAGTPALGIVLQGATAGGDLVLGGARPRR